MAKKDKKMWRYADFESMMMMWKNPKTGGYRWLPFTIEKKK